MTPDDVTMEHGVHFSEPSEMKQDLASSAANSDKDYGEHVICRIN